MRYIDNTSLSDSFPSGWSDRANAALDELRNATSREERLSIVGRKSSLWRELKDALAALSGQKCWYCETANVRSDNAVDHFRPKGSVAESPGHGGYWWLAFEHTNLRFACTFCNSARHGEDSTGGKDDHFPLADEDDRALSEEHIIANELPMLLDPTDPADPALLWFEPDGRAVPKYDDSEHAFFCARGETSIGLYHLNETKIKSRRRDNHRQLLQVIQDAAEHLKPAGKTGGAGSMTSVRSAFRQIRNMVNPSADYSAAAKATLIAYRHEYPWLDQILTT